MTYLILQMLVCLAIAFLLGAVIGFMIGKMGSGRCKKKSCDSKSSKSADAPLASAPVLEDDIDFDMDDLSDVSEMSSPAIKQEGPSFNTVNLGTSIDLDGQGYSIETLEGIGPQTGDLLRGYGVASIGDYLRKLNKPDQREQAAKQLEILEPSLHKWAAMADLLRVEGIDHQFAELLVAGDIRCVRDLGECDVDALAAKLYDLNNAGAQLIAPVSPPAEQIATWVDSARMMPVVVTF